MAQDVYLTKEGMNRKFLWAPHSQGGGQWSTTFGYLEENIAYTKSHRLGVRNENILSVYLNMSSPVFPNELEWRYTFGC